MEPILRPGSVVLVDVSMRRLQENGWSNEYDRPLYFVEYMKVTAADGFSRRARV
jgi:hypothetical protein